MTVLVAAMLLFAALHHLARRPVASAATLSPGAP